MENKQQKDNLSLWLGFWKFVLGTVALGIITAVLNHQIQSRQLAAAEKNQEQAYVEKFVAQALDENLEKRLRFAHYFSSLLKENWLKYYDDIKKEYNKATSDLENKRAELTAAEKAKNKELVEKLQEEIVRLQSEVVRKGDVQTAQASRDIDLLHPEMARRTKEFIRRVKEQGIDVLVYDTYRSIDYQNKLYIEGKTRVKGGRSPHNFGLSFEAVPLIDGKAAWSYDDHKNEWDTLGKIAKEVELAWGGDNARYKEYPNFEFPNWKTLK